MTEVVVEFLVATLIEKYIRLEQGDFDLGTAVLREIRAREKAGQIPLWPPFDYYLHERAVEQTCRPDGRPGTQNAYDRYVIAAHESSVKKRLDTDISSPVSPSYTAEATKSKGEESVRQDDQNVIPRYDHWVDAKTRMADGLMVDWGALFKISCKIANDLCRNPETPVHYHNDFHELVQEAWFAIQFKAIPRYDNRGDVEFTTFAYRVIKNHLLDFTRWSVDPLEDGDKVRTRTGRDFGTSDLDFDALPWGQPRLTKSPHRNTGEQSSLDL